MKLIWHLIKKDSRRLRLPLVVWAGLLAIGAGLALASLQLPETARWNLETARVALNLSWAVSLLVGYVLSAAVVLEDSPTGSTGFWLTRPIAGWRLLAAKVLAVGWWLVGLPVLGGVPWWLYCGYGWAALGRAALHLAVPHAGVSFVGFTLAVATGRSSRFLLGSLLLVAGLPLGAIMLDASRQEQFMTSRLLGSRLELALGLLVLAAVWLVGQRYRSRRMLVGSVGFGVGMVTAVGVGLAWPWEFSRPDGTRGQPPPDMERLEAEILGAGEATRWPSRAPLRAVKIDLQVRGMSTGWAPLSGRADVDLSWADGATVHLLDGVFTWEGDWERSATTQALGFAPVAPDAATVRKREEGIHTRRERLAAEGVPSVLAPGVMRAGVVVQMPGEAYARALSESPRCVVRLRVAVGQPELLLEVPLREAASVAGKNARLRVKEFGPRTLLVGSPGKPTPHWRTRFAGVVAEGVLRPRLYLLNRKHASDWRPIRLPFLQDPRVGRLVDGSVEVPVPRLWRDDAWVEAPDWQETATMAVVGLRPAGELAAHARAARLNFRR